MKHDYVVAGAQLLETATRRVRESYRRDIGLPVRALETPALLLDLATATANIATMASSLRELPADLRPHTKVHKSPTLGRMQIEAGAAGLSVATVWEAVVMLGAGCDDVFIVNTVVSPTKVDILTAIARDRRVLVAVDDTDNIQQLSVAARQAGSVLGVLVEIDTGMDRAGVDTAAEALRLARLVDDLPGVKLEGLTGYEGHCSLISDTPQRQALQRQAMEFFVSIADRLEDEGIRVGIRSAGGTATWAWTAGFPGVTEIQAGSYVLMDNFHLPMAPDFKPALLVASTVLSAQPGRVIVDAGSKSIGDAESSTIPGARLSVVRFDEEHGVFADDGGSSVNVGDVLQLIPGYAPSTVNCFDAYHVVDAGIVVDVWPIVPRGPGHHGLARR